MEQRVILLKVEQKVKNRDGLKSSNYELTRHQTRKKATGPHQVPQYSQSSNYQGKAYDPAKDRSNMLRI